MDVRKQGRWRQPDVQTSNKGGNKEQSRPSNYILRASSLFELEPSLQLTLPLDVQ